MPRFDIFECSAGSRRTSHQPRATSHGRTKAPSIALEEPRPDPVAISTGPIHKPHLPPTVLSLVRAVEKLRTLSSLPRVTGPPSVTCIPQTSPCAVLAFIPVSCVTSPPDYTERPFRPPDPLLRVLSHRDEPLPALESFIDCGLVVWEGSIDVCEPSAESRLDGFVAASDPTGRAHTRDD
jgi:hypothetical protein